MKKLITLAQKFQNNLGKKISNAEVTAPIRKIAKIESKLHKKMAQHQELISKFSAGPTLPTHAGEIPAIYQVCGTCQGRGKHVTAASNTMFKLASGTLNNSRVVRCQTCKGKRVIKTANTKLCSAEQLEASSQYSKDKAAEKQNKKIEKKRKKAAKAVAKAERKQLQAENPMAHEAMKIKKKAEKKAKKAAKKALKAVEKAKKAEKSEANYVEKYD